MYKHCGYFMFWCELELQKRKLGNYVYNASFFEWYKQA